ncbi:MAG: peptidase [Crenarchaeota archaeon]|nr:peptidase [Thermoproteota archaeon]MDA1124630.1 peptidase [Thermoproteota archaeon]
MKIILPLLLVFFVTFSIGTAFGHGAGIEASPLIFTNNRQVKVTVELLPSDFYKSDQKIIKIDAYDQTNRATVENASFKVKIFNDNQLLLDERFYTQDGNLILEVDPEIIVTNRNSIEISGEKNNFGLWEKTDESPLIITGPIFDKGGIYTFKITLDAQDKNGTLSNVEFEVQVSVTFVEYYEENTGQKETKFRVKSYYDKISSFEYDVKKNVAKISFPFDFSETNISHTNVIHTEIMFPKNTLEFLSPNYYGTSNGVELFKSSIFIDDYSEEDNRIVHLVLLPDHLRHIKNQLKKMQIDSSSVVLPDSIDLILNKGKEIQFPLKTLTLSEKYQVDLSWDPKEITLGESIRFIYTFRDTKDLAPIRNSDYTFTILQNGKTIFSEDRFAKIGADYSDYTFEKGQTGLTVVRFSNISGSGQQTEFAFVVGSQVKTSLVPEWVKNNAGWWADGQIPDSAFIDGIEYMIKNRIIVVSDTKQTKSQADGIPEWVKNNAGWWADGQIPDSGFIDGIQYMIKDGIIKIN